MKTVEIKINTAEVNFRKQYTATVEIGGEFFKEVGSFPVIPDLLRATALSLEAEGTKFTNLI